VPDIYREGWLMAFKDAIQSDFARLGYPLPERLRMTCGWPSARAFGLQRRIGECWAPTASADGTTEIIISPSLDDPIEVAAVGVHELIHAAVGTGCGHEGAFKRLAVQMGLQGPMRATHAGPALRERLNALVQALGPYPHAKLDAQGRKKDGTRLLKCECITCGYTVRITRRWIGVGLPVCPCGTRMAQSWHTQKKGGR
jgi:hypothetical protein